MTDFIKNNPATSGVLITTGIGGVGIALAFAIALIPQVGGYTSMANFMNRASDARTITFSVLGGSFGISLVIALLVDHARKSVELEKEPMDAPKAPRRLLLDREANPTSRSPERAPPQSDRAAALLERPEPDHRDPSQPRIVAPQPQPQITAVIITPPVSEEAQIVQSQTSVGLSMISASSGIASAPVESELSDEEALQRGKLMLQNPELRSRFVQGFINVVGLVPISDESTANTTVLADRAEEQQVAFHIEDRVNFHYKADRGSGSTSQEIEERELAWNKARWQKASSEMTGYKTVVKPKVTPEELGLQPQKIEVAERFLPAEPMKN